MLNICLEKSVLRPSWFTLGDSAVIQLWRIWHLLWKCSSSKHLSAGKRLCDRITCSHFLGMIRMFLQHVESVWVMSSPLVVSMATVMWFLSRMIQNSRLYSRWSASAVTAFIGQVLTERMHQVKSEAKHISTWVGLLSLWLDISGNVEKHGDTRLILSSYDVLTILPFICSH